MAHAHHNHGDMDMGHGGHGGGDDMAMCSMNMIFTWDTKNLCIIFSSWRITDNLSLVLSLIGVMALTAGYELLREASRRYEARLAERLAGLPRSDFPPATTTTFPPPQPTLPHIQPQSQAQSQTYTHDDERRSLLGRPSGSAAVAEEQSARFVKAALYGLQVFYSFFIMLLFMTYNGYVMLAVGVGAFLGYLFFGGGSVQKSVACH